MRLTKAEKGYLFKILDNLTDRTGYYEVTDQERRNLTYPLFKKFRYEIRGF